VAIFFRRLRSIPVAALRAGVGIGTVMWLGYELQTVGLLYTTASRSGFLTSLCVVLVPILLALVWRRSINRYILAGVACALAGLYLLCLPSTQSLSFSVLNRGDLLTIACAFAFALQIILVSRAVQHCSPAHLVPVQVAACALWMLLTLPVAEPHGWLRLTPALLAALAFTALLGTVACFLIQAWAQRLTPPTHAALIYSLEPVIAALLSYFFLGERLTPRGLLGAALILAGLLASEILGHVQEPGDELAQEVG
jgi:drug/metabolite transporter (DMT)-like permease